MSASPPIKTTLNDTRCPGADRILSAARKLFAEHGPGGVSIQKIADAAGVSKANVFHHFASKQELYRAVLETAADEFHALLATLNEQTTAHGLSEFSLQHLARLLDDPGTTWLFLRALSEPQAGGSQRRLAEEVVSEAMRAIIAAVDGLRNDEVLPANANAGTLALTLLGANLIYFQLHNLLPRLGDHPPLQDPVVFTEEVTRLLCQAFSSDRTSNKKANCE